MTHPTNSEDATDLPGPGADSSAPDAHGKFSLSEDWLATVAGLGLLMLCVLGLAPDVGAWWK